MSSYFGEKVKISVNHELFYLFALMPFNFTEDMSTHLPEFDTKSLKTS